MDHPSRRDMLRVAGASLLGGSWVCRPVWGQAAPSPDPPDAPIKILHPRDRVPLSFIIDDSTCLVNMGHFCMPQFAAAWPDNAIYRKPWKSWPREIPDAFVREFGEWCAAHGVKGKFSIVPCPACVGWLDRELPGWSRAELRDSLKLVRELMVPNWDIHPEMITHTRVIDLKTGRPVEPICPATMENSYPQAQPSVDELAAYLAYSLQILKNCDLPCEGITTPGGFGNGVESALSLAVQQAVRDVYAAELPHYFKYVAEGDESTQPKLEHQRDLDTADPRLTVNVLAGTGDWFGGWDGDETSQPEKYASDAATSGRMVELIERREPAVMLCHWPGMYTHGTKLGFAAFQKVVLALQQRFAAQTAWMKLSEIARYRAASELTRIEMQPDGLRLQAPFACPNFTLRVAAAAPHAPRQVCQDRVHVLTEVADRAALATGTWTGDGQGRILCFDLPKGPSVIQL